MSRNKGTPKTGGRKAGTPNKVSTDFKRFIVGVLDDGREEFERRLERLEDREYIKIYVGLLGYVVPKMSPTTPEDILRREKEMLQDLLLSLPDEMVNRVSEKIKQLELTEKTKSYESEFE